MSKNLKSQSILNDWLTNPFKATFAAILTIGSILAVGYTIGVGKREMDFEIEKIRLNQNCNERVQEAINSSREVKLDQYQKSIDDIKQVVNEIKKSKNEK